MITDTTQKFRVTFYVDNDSIGQCSTIPYTILWHIAYWADCDTHTIMAIATDEKKNMIRSEPVKVLILNQFHHHQLQYIPSGEFIMGSEIGSFNEQPVHSISLNAYWICQTEITNTQYINFLNESFLQNQIEIDNDRVFKNAHLLIDMNNKGLFVHENDDCHIAFNGKEFYIQAAKYNDYPIVSVTWYGARAYAEHYGMNLPTEAEWEKAARGTDGREYPWGNSAPTQSQCNCGGNIFHPISVGLTSPSGDSFYGCCNMGGNVSEWCLDWYGETYYAVSEPSNPKGPNQGEYKVIRGGNWYHPMSFARCADRQYSDPENKLTTLGFRCIKPIE